MGLAMSADEARERIDAALDAIDSAHDLLRDTPSDLVGNRFRVDAAARLEITDQGVLHHPPRPQHERLQHRDIVVDRQRRPLVSGHVASL